MDFDTTYGDQLYNKLISENKFFKLFHNYIYSTEFINYFLNIFREDILSIFNWVFYQRIFKFRINPQPYEMGAVISKNEIKKEKKIYIPKIGYWNRCRGIW